MTAARWRGDGGTVDLSANEQKPHQVKNVSEFLRGKSFEHFELHKGAIRTRDGFCAVSLQNELFIYEHLAFEFNISVDNTWKYDCL